MSGSTFKLGILAVLHLVSIPANNDVHAIIDTTYMSVF